MKHQLVRSHEILKIPSLDYFNEYVLMYLMRSLVFGNHDHAPDVDLPGGCNACVILHNDSSDAQLNLELLAWPAI